MPSTGSILTVKFIADVASIDKNVSRMQKQFSGLGKAAKATGALVAASFVLEPVIQGLQDAVMAASDYEEALGKVNVVFKEGADEIERWARGSVSAMGQSQQAALETAGTFGNLFVSFGVGAEAAASMSMTLTELASDLASFNNTGIDDAIQALRSGLSGETEPLKRFGIVLNDARLRAELMAQGVTELGTTLTAEQKAMGAYAAIMKDSATAQGDFARTSDNLANRLRTATGAIEDAQRVIGEELLLSINEMVNTLGGSEGVVQYISELANGFRDLISLAPQLNSELDTTAKRLKEVNGYYVYEDKGSSDLFTKITQLIPVIGTYVGLLLNNKENSRQAEQAQKDLAEATDAYYDGLAANTPEMQRAQREIGDLTTVAVRAGREAMIASYGWDVYYEAAMNAERAVAAQARRQTSGTVASAIVEGLVIGPDPDVIKKTRDFGKILEDIDKTGRGSSGGTFDDLQEIGKQTFDLGPLEIAIGKLSDLTGDQAEGINKQLENFRETWSATWTKYEGDLQAAKDYVTDWQRELIGVLDIGKAFTLANDAQAREEDALKNLNKVLSDPKASAQAISSAKNAYYEAAADAAVSWQEGFAQQIRDANAFYEALGSLKDSGLNEALVRQVAALGPGIGTDLAKDLVGQEGLIGQLNRDWEQVEAKTLELGIGMSDTFQEIGITNAQANIDAYIGQVQKAGRKVRREIKDQFSTTVKIRFEPDYSAMPGGFTATSSNAVVQRGVSATSRGRRIVEDIQAYELVSGSSWRV